MTTFDLPDLGEGLVEAGIVQWLVEVGDEVALNQPLAEVETAKAIVEIPSPFAGVVSRLHADVGDTVAVGASLVTFAVDGEDPGSAAPPATAADAADEPPEPTLVGYGAAAQASGRPRRRRRAQSIAPRPAPTPRPEAVPSAAAAPRGAPGAETERSRRPRATPPVRIHARSRGVDLEELASSVGDRVITREDVDLHAAGGLATIPQSGAAAPGAATQPGGTTRVPVRGVRKATAEAMVRSAFTAPHATVFHTLDVTETMELISSLDADQAYAEHRIGLLAVVAKAVCLALRSVPEVNARWNGDAGEILQFGSVNLGIAADTDRGLLVPTIHGADRLSLVELADELHTLTDAARSGKTSPQSLAGGTFSITNVGVFGVDTGTPILPPGQAGILAVGAVRRRPWEHDGEIALRQVLTLSLSFDHRVVDGAEGSRFLMAVAGLLESPARAMLWA